MCDHTLLCQSVKYLKVHFGVILYATESHLLRPMYTMPHFWTSQSDAPRLRFFVHQLQSHLWQGQVPPSGQNENLAIKNLKNPTSQSTPFVNVHMWVPDRVAMNYPASLLTHSICQAWSGIMAGFPCSSQQLAPADEYSMCAHWCFHTSVARWTSKFWSWCFARLSNDYLFLDPKGFW